jgi:hypothetical protein
MGNIATTAQDRLLNKAKTYLNKLVIKDSNGNVLANFSGLTWGSPSGTNPRQVSVTNLPLTVTASATGTAATAEFQDSAGTAHISGVTVGTSGTPVVINSTNITSGQPVRLNSVTLKAPNTTIT